MKPPNQAGQPGLDVSLSDGFRVSTDARQQKRLRDNRKYGRSHRRLRARWASLVAQGGVSCARCQKLIEPGTPWDLGHADQDDSQYWGPEHRRCNRATAGRSQRWHSRDWAASAAKEEPSPWVL